MSCFSISIQQTYTSVEYALFNHQHLITTAVDDKVHASKNIIITLQGLLARAQLSLPDLSFIGANRGPGPFTTLRTVIATVNGIGFASSVPLIGINGIEALVREYQATRGYTIGLLNAFGHDVYYGIAYEGKLHDIGCAPYAAIIQQLAQHTQNQPVYFVGNAVSTYSTIIKDQFKERATIPSALPAHCSVRQIGTMAYEHWQQEATHHSSIEPLYLKIQY